MTSNAEGADLEQLYAELRRFAPSDDASEMADLARRIGKLSTRVDDGSSATSSTLDEIWSRVEDHLDTPSDRTDG